MLNRHAADEKMNFKLLNQLVMRKPLLMIIFSLLIINSIKAQNKNPAEENDRQLWLNYLDRIARPVILLFQKMDG